MTLFSKKIQKQTGCVENAVTFATQNVRQINAQAADIRKPIFRFNAKNTNKKKDPFGSFFILVQKLLH